MEKQKGSGPGWIVVLLIGCALGWLMARRKPKGEICSTKEEPEPEDRYEDRAHPRLVECDGWVVGGDHKEEPERPTVESGTGPPSLVLVAIDAEINEESRWVSELDSHLTNVEYLAIKMQECPGESQRFYRGNLFRYRNGVFRSDNYGQYFRRSSRYRNNLWVDRAPRNATDKMPWSGPTTKPKLGELHLTQDGWELANRVREKVGVETIPWSINLD